MPRTRLVYVLATALTLACGNATNPGGDARDTAPANAGTGGLPSTGLGAGEGGTGTPLSAAKCEGVTRDVPSAAQNFQQIRAKMVDQAGRVAQLDAVQVCGFDVCLSGSTDALGAVVVGGEVVSSIVGPAFKYGQGREFAELAYPLGGAAMRDLGSVATLRLPELDTSSPIAAGQVAQSGGVRLDVAAGSEVSFDQIAFREGAERGFRAAIAIGFQSLALDASLGLELVVGTTPVGTTFCPPASLSIANEPAWPPGTDVEVFVHGVALDQRFAPYGGWARVGTGHVSEAGDQIELLQAVPVLSVFGLRRASK